MTWTQVQDEIEATDYWPIRRTRVKKMIWSDADQAFRTHYFLRVTCDTSAIRNETTEWLTQQFGPDKYLGTWWQDPQNSRTLWLADRLATFWQLKYGDRE